MFRFIYDLLVYLTCNFSKMPDEFKKRFQEDYLVKSRINIGSINNFEDDFSDYE